MVAESALLHLRKRKWGGGGAGLLILPTARTAGRSWAAREEVSLRAGWSQAEASRASLRGPSSPRRSWGGGRSRGGWMGGEGRSGGAGGGGEGRWGGEGGGQSLLFQGSGCGPSGSSQGGE